MRGKYKNLIMRGFCLVMMLLITAGMTGPVQAAETEKQSVELVAAFDKSSYAAGDTVTVSFIVYGADFDAAGFHVAYDSDSLSYQSSDPRTDFRMPVRKTGDGTLEITVQSSEVQTPGSDGIVIAKVSFTAVTDGGKTLDFTEGSAEYLEGKPAAAYNGYQVLDVKSSVEEDAAAGAALRRKKAQAVEQLKNDIDEKTEAGVTVAQRQLLEQCFEDGRTDINNASTEREVDDALQKALAAAEEIAKETSLEFPKLTALYDAENNDSTVLSDLYPAFSPDNTAYFLYTNRPLNGTARKLKGATTDGVTVTFNGEKLNVQSDGTFIFEVPFQTMENCNTLVLKDEATGLTSTCAFYSFGYGVTSTISNVKIYDGDGKDPGDRIGDKTENNSVVRVSSSIDTVRIGFDGKAPANQEFHAELVDQQNQVIQTFVTASGDDPVKKTFLSDPVHLKKGLNWVLLRYLGTDNSHWEDGKPVPIEAYKTTAILINYTDPNDDDPALSDTEPEKIELFLKGTGDGAEATWETEPVFEWKEATKTTPARYESTMELTPEDFDQAYLTQVMHLRVALKSGQEITVNGGNETPQRRTLLKDGTYHVADYYESFGSADKPTIMKKDSFQVTITVTAKDGIHKTIYLMKVNKSGKAAIVIPKSYQSRELTITDKRPIRTQQLPFGAVSITDKEGNAVDVARALDEETLKIEILSPEVASWDGKTRNGGNITVQLVKQGKTDIRLTYDDGDAHMEGTAVLYVNYTVGMLSVVRSDAFDLLSESTSGKRQYEDGAEEALREVIRASNAVYEKYENKDRRLMNQEQFDEINDAVNALYKASDTFRHKEKGIKIVEFVNWPPADLPTEVPYNVTPEMFTPKTLTGKDAAGKTYEMKVTWSCKPVWDTTEWDKKYYTFTAVLPAGYVPAEGVDYPSFVVLKGLRPVNVKLTKNEVKFPEACQVTNREKTRAVLRVYTGTTLEEIYNPDNPNGKEGSSGLGLQTSVQSARTWLPTDWLEVPKEEEFDSSVTSAESGKTYEFKFTLKPGSEAGWVNYEWSNEVPEDQKIYTMTVEVVDPPTLKVEGLENYGQAVTVQGTKYDTVFGVTKDGVSMDPITLGPDNDWTCQLTDRGEKLVPLTYEFVPEEVEGYTAKVSQNGSDWVIEYIQDQPDSLTITPEKLVLTENGQSKIYISEHLNAEVYDSLKWETDQEEDSDSIEVRHISSGNTYQVKASAEGIYTLTAKLGEDLESNPCTIVVLPKKLTLEDLSLQTGEQKQLTLKEAELLKKAGLTITWTSDDPKVADVDAGGVVMASGKGSTEVRVSVRTDKGTVSGSCTITVTSTDEDNNGGNGNNGNGNGNGGNGNNGSGNGGNGTNGNGNSGTNGSSGGGSTLKGQKTSGGTYSDRLSSSHARRGNSVNSTNSTVKTRTGTTQKSSQVQESVQQTETTETAAETETAEETEAAAEDNSDADGAAGSGEGTGEEPSGRIIAVSKEEEEKTAETGKKLAALLLICGLLLTAGILHGKRKGEN